MFSRAALSVRNIVKGKPMSRSMGDYVVTDFKAPTMSDLPTPGGSWADHYSKKQRAKNLQLLGGVAFATVTVVTAKNSGLIEFGWGPKIGK